MAEGHGSRDFTAAKSWMWSDEKSFATLIELLVEATIEHLSAQIDAGADCVQIFDSWAGVLPDREFFSWVIAPTARIAKAVKKRHGSARILGFPRGAGHMYEAYAVGAGVDGVSLDYTVPIGFGRVLQRRVAVQGNLDPILLVMGGASMIERAREICAAFSAGPHVFNLGHGVLPETPPEHVTALIAAVRACA
jgi:uroporphyrinogen decarboxylase